MNIRHLKRLKLIGLVISVLLLTACGSATEETGETANERRSEESSESDFELGEVSSSADDKSDSLDKPYSASPRDATRLAKTEYRGEVKLRDSGDEISVWGSILYVEPDPFTRLDFSISPRGFGSNVTTQKLGFLLFQKGPNSNRNHGALLNKRLKETLLERDGWSDVGFVLVEEVELLPGEEKGRFDVAVKDESGGGSSIETTRVTLSLSRDDFAPGHQWRIFPVPYQHGSEGDDFFLNLEGTWEYTLQADCGPGNDCLPKLEFETSVSDKKKLTEETSDRQLLTIEEALGKNRLHFINSFYHIHPASGEDIEVSVDETSLDSDIWPESVPVGFLLFKTAKNRELTDDMFMEIEDGARPFNDRIKRKLADRDGVEYDFVVLTNAKLRPDAGTASFEVAARKARTGDFVDRDVEFSVERDLFRETDDAPKNNRWGIYAIPHGDWEDISWPSSGIAETTYQVTAVCGDGDACN